jgi:lipase ATG15
MGTCTGKLSTCGIAGYAMESQCHIGNVIEYDTVTNLSWSVRLTTHPIATVIENILSKPWAMAEELGLEVPPIKRQDDCVVRWVLMLLLALCVDPLAGLLPVGVR